MGRERGSRTAAAIRAVGASYVTRGLSILLGFVVTPIVLAHVGRDLYGFWVIVGSVIGYVGMVDFGVTGSVEILIARQQADIDSVNRIASNALAVHLGSGIVAFLLAVAASVYGPKFLNVPPDQGDLVAGLICLAGAGLAISFPVRTLKAVLRGTQRIATVRLAEFVLMLLQTVLMLLLLSRGSSILALPQSTIVCSVLGLMVFYALAVRRIPGFKVEMESIARAELGPILSVSAWWFLGSLGALLIYQTDNIVIGKFLGSAAVTTYALTSRVPQLIRAQIYQLNRSVAPGVGELVGKKETGRLQELFFIGTKIVLFLGLSSAVMISKLNRGFTSLWVGEQNYGGDLLTVLLSTTLVYLVVFHLSSVILTNHLDLKILAGTRFVEGFVNIVLSLALVRQYGLNGVVAATLLAGLLTTGWIVPLRACRILNASYLKYLRETLGNALVFCGVALLGSLAVPGGGAENWWALLGRAVILGAWLLLAGWFVLLPRREVLGRLKSLAQSFSF